MLTSHTLKLTAPAALTALAGASYAFEASGQNPPASATIVTTVPSPSHQYVVVYPAYRPYGTTRAEVLADLQWARANGLMNDTGEAGASDRVLERREAFPETERNRALAILRAEQDYYATPYRIIIVP